MYSFETSGLATLIALEMDVVVLVVVISLVAEFFT
jgi:hypothetical protein